MKLGRAFRVMKPSFETWVVRKAYHAVVKREKNPFSEDDAIAEFGVGKNMVSAIKYWSLATGFLEAENDQIRASSYSRVLIENARDPFLEDLDTIWKIHYELVKPQQHIGSLVVFILNENIFDEISWRLA